MAITTLSMVLTAFALNLHYITDRPVPLWLHRLVLVYIAKLVGKCSSRTTIAGSIRNKKRVPVAGRDCRKPSEPCPEGSAKSTSRRRAQIRINHSADDRQFSSAVVEFQEPASADSGVAIWENGTRQDEASGSRAASQSLETANDGNADFSRNWRKVAEVFDRLFFWFFLLAILISTLVLFHPLTDSYMKRIA